MNRSEALSLIGAQVRVWTAANGVYAGVLEGIAGSPWRGTVRVTGVVEVAQHLERGMPCRRGFRPGETLQAGAASIRLLHAGDRIHADYLSALLAEKASWLARQERVLAGPNAWLPPALLLALDVVIAAEHRRLQGLPWSLGPSG